MGNAILNNKASALRFLEMVSTGKVSEAFDSLVGAGFRHHNVYYEGHAEALKEAMEESAVSWPDKKLEVQFCISENDRVAVYSKINLVPGGLEMALVHLFRFSDGKIIELWDIAQAPPEELINENGLF